MFAIVETGGKQYKVREGDQLKVEKLSAEPGEEISLDRVICLGGDEEVQLGRPYVENAKVKCDVLEQSKDRKVLVFKHKRRKDYRRTRGHRQCFTRLKVKAIQA
ncbi:MAG: 50S ribosomal protein L21 [Desulfonatronovibrionaceae bacterium]